MTQYETFFPQAVYAAGNETPPRVIVAPPKYIQGPGVLDQIGRYLALLNLGRSGVLASPRGHATQAGRIAEALAETGVDCISATFGGECSLEEIDKHAEGLASESLDCLIAVGGGKCVDAGKCIAHRLGVPLAVIPTLASNDAPCSAVSVLYTPQGVVSGAEFFPVNPALVVVDTQVVAEAPERYLVAGIGDAMATWYEAKVCFENPEARTVLGARPTVASVAIGEVCASTLFNCGVAACEAVREGVVTDDLERVVEANTLLSGIGFESGGLAAAHGVAQGYTALPAVETNYLHGEMVGMGVVTQLVMEDKPDEAKRVAKFFTRVGLPVTLDQMGLEASDTGALDALVEGTLAFQAIANLPFPVTADVVREAVLRADKLGVKIIEKQGDTAFKRLHA